MWLRTIIFLVINFAALGIGGLFTSKGVPSQWYQNLNKAPWTPPGWMFGFAWTFIMISFAFYMAYAWENIAKRNLLIILFAVQWVLNVAWNPVFFKYHEVTLGLVVIVSLTVLLGIFVFMFYNSMKYWTLLVLPYFIWLLIASSLNAYILFKN
ncbi:MAG: TspO protein [Marinilabiliales bacterium]|nr:MAG: TspO protein [Marinilabiliales bacterium]